jgi:hypothetical protein
LKCLWLYLFSLSEKNGENKWFSLICINNSIWFEYCNLIGWSAWWKFWLYLITWVGIVTSPTYSFYKYNLFKISNIPYKLIFTTKFIDSSILITIISCDYLNLSLANEYVGDVTIPTQIIKYNQYFLQHHQPIILQYSNQIKLFKSIAEYNSHCSLSYSCILN